jgi:hypothetical protein
MNSNTWLQLLYKGVLVQSLVTLGLVGGLIYLWCTRSIVPEEMLKVTYFCLGFWGGSTGAIVAYQNGHKTTPAAPAAPAAPSLKGDV